MAFCAATPIRLPRSARSLLLKRVCTTARVKPEPTLDALVARTAYSGIDRGLARQTISKAVNAVREWSVATTDFLTPPESGALLEAASFLRDMHVRAWGGYDDADRTILVFAHTEIVPPDGVTELVSDELAVLDVQGAFADAKVNHRDFMGAILNAGVNRNKIGDINLLEGRGAQAIVRSDVASAIAAEVTQIRNISVSTRVLPMSELLEPERRVKELVAVESSMRLDAVASAAFKVSRTKMADMARAGLVRINYVDIRAPAKSLKSRDVVSVRGFGKFEVGKWETTAKGRFRITLQKYV